MLSKLYISNYVLINNLEVDFKSEFTVITGETGAGKSILLGALSLILGDRADIARKGNPDKKIVAEGEFNISEYQLDGFFEKHNLDYEPAATNLRREIVPSGKSRAFINDTPVSLSILKSLGEKLVDIHSQHENQQLLKSAYQLAFLDAYSGISGEVEKFGVAYQALKSLQSKLQELQDNEKKARQEEDYLRFQLTEIEEAELDKIDFENLQSELDVLDNADGIKNGFKGALHHLADGDSNALSLLKESLSSLQESVQLSDGFKDLTDRLNSAIIELDDIRTEIEYKDGTVESNPEKAEFIRSSIDKVNHLLFKHGLTKLDELLKLESNLQASLNQLDGYTEEIVSLQLKMKKITAKMQKSAEGISSKRKKHAPKLEELIASGLRNLGMPHAQLNIDLVARKEFSITGLDDVMLKFSANKGFAPQPLEKVASGGERSRLMLVLKKIYASVAQTPTLILDEIDTGISGEIAAKTAQMLSEMAGDSQIISITHLPQVAGRAQHHLRVSKSAEGDTTETKLQILSNQERILEIARMLSGENITDAALENASSLMS